MHYCIITASFGLVIREVYDESASSGRRHRSRTFDVGYSTILEHYEKSRRHRYSSITITAVKVFDARIQMRARLHRRGVNNKCNKCMQKQKIDRVTSRYPTTLQRRTSEFEQLLQLLGKHGSSSNLTLTLTWTSLLASG